MNLSLDFFLQTMHAAFLFHRFLSLLEQEIYNPQSPIWREDFNQTPEALAIPSPAGSSITPTSSPAAGPASNISRMGKANVHVS